MASHSTRLDTVLAEPIAQSRQARTIFELEQMLHLERTIKRVEAQPLPRGPHPPGPRPAPLAPRQRRHVRPERRARLIPRAPIGMVAEAPIQGSNAMRLSIRSFLQVGAATAIGVTVFLGISAWVHWVRPAATHSARVSPLRLPPGEIRGGTAETVGYAQARRIEPPPPPHNSLPFPLPVSYGVYAGSNGQLTELEPLPVEVPARARGLVRRNHQAEPGHAAGGQARVHGVQAERRQRRPRRGIGARGRRGSRAPPPSSISGRR